MGKEVSKRVGNSIRNAWVAGSIPACGTRIYRVFELSLLVFLFVPYIVFRAGLGVWRPLRRTKTGTEVRVCGGCGGSLHRWDDRCYVCRTWERGKL
jgi:hypothetical protein